MSGNRYGSSCGEDRHAIAKVQCLSKRKVIRTFQNLFLDFATCFFAILIFVSIGKSGGTEHRQGRGRDVCMTVEVLAM